MRHVIVQQLIGQAGELRLLTGVGKRFVTARDYKFEYMLLNRLQCDYYLGYGGRDAQHCLWAHDEQKQIDARALRFVVKPEWLTREQIDDYAKQLGVK